VVSATPVETAVAVAVAVGTAQAHSSRRAVVIPLRLVVVVLVVIPPCSQGRAPLSIRIRPLEAVVAAPAAVGAITAPMVLLVVVVPVKVRVETVRLDRDKAVVPQGRTAAAAVVVLVLAVEMESPRAATRLRTKLVTAETVHRLRLAGRLLREPAVEEEEAALLLAHTPLALQPEAANGRVMVVVEAAVPAVPVVSTVTGVKPAAAQTAPRIPASPAVLILVAVVVVAPLVAWDRDSQIRALAGPVLLLLGIFRQQCMRSVVPKPATAIILYIPSFRLVHLRFIILRQ